MLDCSIARPVNEVSSLTTVHFPGPPRPVRANLKSAGAAPTSMFAMATTDAADCDRPSAPDVTRTPVTSRATNSRSGKGFGLFPCMRNLLERSSVAQSLDGIGRLAGSLRFPVGGKLCRPAPRRNSKGTKPDFFIWDLSPPGLRRRRSPLHQAQSMMCSSMIIASATLTLRCLIDAYLDFR